MTLKKDDKYHIPFQDAKTGEKNPHYPTIACESCCESNLPQFYDRTEDSVIPIRALRANRILVHGPDQSSLGPCPLCEAWGYLYYTESYSYPYFYVKNE